MLQLLGTTQSISVLSGTAEDLELYYSYVDAPNPITPSSNFTPGPATQPANITTAATIADRPAAPGASTARNIGHYSIFNNGASSNTIEIQLVDSGGPTSRLWGGTLLTKESVKLNENGDWLHYDANGGVYPSVGNAATQAEMEAGTSTSKYVTPQGVNWHPGANKCWVKCGVSANVLASWNVTSLTDNGTGDVTVTIATDFSSVNYCANVTVEMTATTYGVANTREPHIRSGGQAAGTLRCDCVDNTATTSLIKDPTAWHISMLGDQ